MSLFVSMLLLANYEDQENGGKIIPRGSFISGRRELAKLSRLSEQITRTAINHFIKHKMITVIPCANFSIFTVLNYNLYQINTENPQPKTSTQDNPNPNPIFNPAFNPNQNLDFQGSQTRLDPKINPEPNPKFNNKTTHKRTTFKEHKEVAEDKNVLNLFEGFWQSYTPIKVNNSYVEKGSKKQALAKFEQILNKGTKYEEITHGLQKYLGYCRDNQIKSCGVSVFLHQERWLDDYASPTVDAALPRGQQQRSVSKTDAMSELINSYRN